MRPINVLISRRKVNALSGEIEETKFPATLIEIDIHDAIVILADSGKFERVPMGSLTFVSWDTVYV